MRHKHAVLWCVLLGGAKGNWWHGGERQLAGAQLVAELAKDF